MDEKITQEQYLKLLKNVDEAENDTTPYVGVINNEVVIEGDPNETFVQKQNYTARFLFPKEMASAFPDAEDVGHGYVRAEIEYKDVFPDAMNNLKYTSAMARMMPFYRKLEESGSVEKLSTDEAIDLFASLSDQVIEALYHLVQVVLGIDDKLIGYLAPGSAINIASRIVQDFPSIVNEGDLFFGSPTSEQ